MEIKSTSIKVTEARSAADLETWSLVVIPDTQRLAPNNASAYNSLMQWVVDNETAEDIRMVIHLGDYANNGGSSTEWGVINTAVSRLHANNIPFIHCAGNHDYDDDGQGTYSRKTTNWETVFPESDWVGNDWYIDAYEGITTNTAAKLTIGNKSYLFLAVEFAPRAGALSWAQSVINANPTDRIIFATHALTDPEARYYAEDRPVDGTGQAGQPKYYGICDYSENADCKTGEEIYNEFISQNPNIILATSGHDVVSNLAADESQGLLGKTAFSKRVDTVSGNPINVHLFNYQNESTNSYENSAYLRIYRFNHLDKSAAVETYNPVRDTSLVDTENQFLINFN